MSSFNAPMNDANEIDTQSLLFGFLAEYAQQNRFSAALNRRFKEEGDNAMCIPMNIRPDDIYFTINSLKEAKLNGVALGAEYVEGVLEQLGHKSDEVEACGFCDTIIVKNKELYGEVATGRAVAELLKEHGAQRLAVLGSGKVARSLVLHLKDSGVKELVFFNDRVESCLKLVQDFGASFEGIDVDIDRAAEGEALDLSSFDAFFNATPSAPKLINIQKEALLIDFKNESSLSSYATEYGANFINNEQYAKVLARVYYTIWIKGSNNERF